jgi:hypothetical protein
MLKKVHNDINVVHDHIRYLTHKANDTYDTGFVSCRYKEDLVKLKWYIEDQIAKCPNFGQIEDEWYKERTLQLLKRDPHGKL